MASNVHKKVIAGHSADLQEALVYKDKYENLMDDIVEFDESKFDEGTIDTTLLKDFEGTEEEKIAKAKQNPVVVLKALKNTCADLKTEIVTMKREVGKLNKEKAVYEDYVESNISKKVCRNLLNRAQKEFNELGAIQLRKIKVEKVKVEVIDRESAVERTEGKSMKALASFFENSMGSKGNTGYNKTVTLLDEGNVKRGGGLRKSKLGNAFEQG